MKRSWWCAVTMAMVFAVGSLTTIIYLRLDAAAASEREMKWDGIPLKIVIPDVAVPAEEKP